MYKAVSYWLYGQLEQHMFTQHKSCMSHVTNMSQMLSKQLTSLENGNDHSIRHTLKMY